MSILKRTYKQFNRTAVAPVLAYMRVEARHHGDHETAGYGDLSILDFGKESVYWLMIDERRVGFISIRYDARTDIPELRKVYVAPQFRRQGVVRYALEGLKVQKADVPVGLVHFLGLCVRMGFRYNTNQSFPMQLAELSRVIKEKVSVPRAPRYVSAR